MTSSVPAVLMRPCGFYDNRAMPAPPEIDPPQPGILTLSAIVADLAGVYRSASRRLGKWLEENEEGITAFLASMQVYAAVQPQLRLLWDKWSDTEWGHLIDEVDFGNALGLLLLLDQRQDDAIEDMLEPALTDDMFLAEVARALDTAQLPSANRRQLLRAVDFIAERDFELAVPLLIVPLEGAFWHVAESVGLVEPARGGRMQFTSESGKSGHAGSIEAVFALLDIDPDFHSFLLRLVYSANGNPFRHGNARDGWRRSGLLLMIALVGWLDLYSDTKEKALLQQAFARHDDGLDVAIARLPGLGVVAEHKPDAVRPTVDLLVKVHTRSSRLDS
jgi:hypothetical protein